MELRSCPAALERAMIHPRPVPLAFAFALSLAMSATGCGSPTTPPAGSPKPGPAADAAHSDDHGHDHGDHVHPATLAEGVEQLQKALATITTSLATGAKDAADEAVHEVAHILEDLEGLVEKQDVTAELKETGRAAVGELNECFDKLDQALHAAEGEGESAVKVLGSVTERIGNAIVSLGALIKGEATPGDATTKEGT
jgi:hypothetical protein